MSQAHAAVSEARSRESQIRSEASAIVSVAWSLLESESHAMRTQVEVLQRQAQLHTKGVESRAHDPISEMQTKRQQEIDRIQQISNESHQNSQQLLHDALQENQVFVEKLKEQEYLLNQQRHEQTEMRSVIQGLRLQQQVDAMRSQPVVFENRTPENAAVNESELVQVL